MLHNINRLYGLTRDELRSDISAPMAVARFLSALEAGELRAAHRQEDGRWVADPDVKRGILVAFRLGELAVVGHGATAWTDKHTFQLPSPDLLARGVRIVPGGSSLRAGAYLGRDVVCMPPMFVNVGAYIDDGTMVDSHALVGSCAQIGKRVHLSAAAQIGGVLEPIGQNPVVIEDDVMVGGNTGVYEGVIVRRRAVLGTGVILNASTPVYDLVREEVLRATPDEPLTIPEGAVVVPGSRAVGGAFAQAHGLHVAAALIVKYRDERTDARTALEDALRG